MSVQEGAGETGPHHHRRRRFNPRWAYPEVDALVDEVEELSTLAPSEIRRYTGGKR